MSASPLPVCRHSLEVGVPASCAWAFMTDVGNWNDPPAQFALDGPFAEGARGTTCMPGQPALSWTVRDVTPGRTYTIEAASMLDGAVFHARWRFEAVSPHACRVTQHVELSGENAAAHVDEVRAAVEPTLAPGMRRVASRMEHHHSEDRCGTGCRRG
jgi:hypothetical protein